MKEVTRIQIFCDFSHTDAGFFFSFEDLPWDGSGAAVFREQRRVQVESGLRRDLEPRFRNHFSVGRDDETIGTKIHHFLLELWVTEFGRRKCVDSRFFRALFDRIWLKLETATLGPVRRRDDG